MYLVEMIIDGQPVQKIRDAGKTYLPIVKGVNFGIKITNQTHKRVTAVISVDGLSVMNGKNASHNDQGYVLGPYESTTIDGWRRGSNEIAMFEISDKEDSYASKTDRPANVGVIGVVFYPEKIKVVKKKMAYKIPEQPWVKDNVYRGGSNEQPIFSCLAEPTSKSIMCSNGPSGPCGQSIRSAGTSYGQTKEDHVTSVSFERDDRYKKFVVLYYDTVEALRAKGVPVDQYVGTPNPFPAEDSSYYCPPPRS